MEKNMDPFNAIDDSKIRVGILKAIKFLKIPIYKYNFSKLECKIKTRVRKGDILDPQEFSFVTTKNWIIAETKLAVDKATLSIDKERDFQNKTKIEILKNNLTKDQYLKKQIADEYDSLTSYIVCKMKIKNNPSVHIIERDFSILKAYAIDGLRGKELVSAFPQMKRSSIYCSKDKSIKIITQYATTEFCKILKNK
jgi:hypothetical protein